MIKGLKLKYEHGTIMNNDGKAMNIVTEIKPFKTGDAILAGLTLASTVYLFCRAFCNGAEAWEQAEFRTLSELGIIK